MELGTDGYQAKTCHMSMDWVASLGNRVYFCSGETRLSKQAFPR
jgi:hypothetical protein